MSSRTRTLLLTGCFFLVGLFAPLPRLGASGSAAARDSAGRVAGTGAVAAPAVLGELAPAVLGARSLARR